MTFDAAHVFLALVFSAVGFGYFIYGKRRADFWTMIAGLGLGFYGYFVESLTWTVAIGIGLMLLPFLAQKLL